MYESDQGFLEEDEHKEAFIAHMDTMFSDMK